MQAVVPRIIPALVGEMVGWTPGLDGDVEAEARKPLGACNPED
jgi:hypothetical protein